MSECDYYLAHKSRTIGSSSQRFKESAFECFNVKKKMKIGNLLSTPDLLDVFEDVDDVPGPSGTLLNLAGQDQAGHGHHVEGKTDQRLGVVESVKQHTPCCHGNLE